MFMLPGFFLGLTLFTPTISMKLIIEFCLSFISIGLASSANYLLNEFNDRKFDKFHPIKSTRAAVSFTFSKELILAVWICVTVLSLLLAATLLNSAMVSVVILLIFFGAIYNLKPFRVKDIPILDVIWESLNGPLRVYAGWIVVTSQDVPPLSFLFTFYFFSIFLMSAKRISEYKLFKICEKSKDLEKYRKSFVFYNEERLLIQAFTAAMLGVFFFTIFSFKWNLNWIVLTPIVVIFLAVYLERVLNKPLSVTETPHKYFGGGGRLAATVTILLGAVFLYFDKNDFLAQLIYSYQLNLQKLLGL